MFPILSRYSSLFHHLLPLHCQTLGSTEVVLGIFPVGIVAAVPQLRLPNTGCLRRLQTASAHARILGRKEGVNIRILRVYLEIVHPHNWTVEPHCEVFHYLEWIRSAQITQNPVVNSQNHRFFDRL